jgi:hypothetical protein
MPDYSILGIAGLVAATLAIGLKVVWSVYQQALRDIATQNAAHVKMLVDLTVTLASLTAIIEGLDRTMREAANARRP